MAFANLDSNGWLEIVAARSGAENALWFATSIKD